MATAVRKILGQISPNSVTETTLYTVPASTSTVLSSLVVCNRGATTATFRVSISVAGGATANKDYIYYDVICPPNDTFIATVGLTLQAAVVVRAYASTGNTSFSVYGEEQS